MYSCIYVLFLSFTYLQHIEVRQESLFISEMFKYIDDNQYYLMSKLMQDIVSIVFWTLSASVLLVAESALESIFEP